MIFSTPKDSMSLKRIAVIRAEDDSASAGLPQHRIGTSKDTHHFANSSAVILYVFDHFMAEDQVERPGRKRKAFTCGVQNVNRIHPCFGGALKVIFQAEHFPSKWGEMFHIHAHATSVFEYSPADAFAYSFDDHIQPALLPRTPDVGWLAA